MKHIKDIINNKMVHMLIAVVLFLVISGVTITYLTVDGKNYDMVKLNSGWTVIVNGEEYTNDYKLKEDIEELYINHGDQITLTKKLTKDMFNSKRLYPVIGIKTDNSLIDVYVNDKKIVKNYNNDRVKGNFYGRLPKEYMGATLKIEFKDNGDDVNNIINDIFLISENNYFLYQLRDNLLKHIAGTVLIVLGLILITIVIAIPNRAQEFKKLVWVGLISLFGGFGLYANFDLLNLYVNDVHLTETIGYMSLFACIISVLLMARSIYIYEGNKKFILYYTIGLGCIYAVLEILYLSKIIKYSNISVGISISTVITVIMLMYFNFINFDKVNSLEKRYLLGTGVCYIEIIITGILSVVIENTNWKVYEKYFLLLIIITFFIGILLYYANVLYFYMDKMTQKNILLHVAYTDYLTGLDNRAKYEEVVEELRMDKLEDMVVISFDLDNLKKINDNEGHDAGDVYIKKFAKSLKENLEQYGFVGRIGGDEFCSIINNKTIDITNTIGKIQKLFMDELKDEKWHDKVSFSYGYAYGSEVNEIDIEELINLADKRMYEFKSKSKKGRDM